MTVLERQLWGQRLLRLEFNVTGFDRYEFKFRPKRSDFGRKKLRTAETAVGFRLSEVVLSPGRRGGKLGGLQQALRRTPVFYPGPYRADSHAVRAFWPRGVSWPARWRRSATHHRLVALAGAEWPTNAHL